MTARQIEDSFYTVTNAGELFVGLTGGTLPSDAEMRQDDHGGAPVLDQFIDTEGMVRMLYLYFAHAADPGFQQATAAAVAASGTSSCLIELFCSKGRSFLRTLILTPTPTLTLTMTMTLTLILVNTLTLTFRWCN